jgi:hypothetical protein
VNTRRLLAVVVVLAFGLAAASLLWTRSDSGSKGTATGMAEPTPGPERGRQPAAAGKPAVDLVPAVPAPSRAPAGPRDQQLALPDDTFVPCLNGARGAPDLREYWGNRPFSPIVAVERSDLGVDWYVHADGTRTTTEMKWRSDLGRFDAMTRVAVPLDRAPPTGAARSGQ